VLVSSVEVAQFIEVAAPSNEPPTVLSYVFRMFVPSSARRQARGPSPEGRPARPRLLPRQRTRPIKDHVVLARSAETPWRWVKTRPRFRRRLGARHHPGARTSPPPPCGALARRRASAPTRGTLPDCGISSTRPTQPSTGHHSGRRSPSQVSDALRPIGHVARGSYPPGRTPYVPGSRPGIVSTVG